MSGIAGVIILTQIAWYPTTTTPEPGEALILGIPSMEAELAILGTYSERDGYCNSDGQPIPARYVVACWAYFPVVPKLLPAISAHTPSKAAA